MYSRKHYLQNKNAARKIILESLDFFARLYGVRYRKVAIRNQRSKWGSCSKARNLNFNYKVALLPKDQRDYVVVHELCHLIEFNHSRRFWAEVARTIPNYKELRMKVKSVDLRQMFVAIFMGWCTGVEPAKTASTGQRLSRLAHTTKIQPKRL